MLLLRMRFLRMRVRIEDSVDRVVGRGWRFAGLCLIGLPYLFIPSLVIFTNWLVGGRPGVPQMEG
jgi:hypothetical protein